MRALILLLTLFIVFAMILDIYTTVSATAVDMEKVKDPSRLIYSLIPPPGEEKTYKLIFAGVNPFDVDKRRSAALGGDKKGDGGMGPKERHSASGGSILSKVALYYVSEGRLYATLLLYNPSSVKFEDEVKAVCRLYSNGKPVDFGTWSGKISIPAKKAVRLKNVDLGPVSIEFDSKAQLVCNIFPKG